VKSVLESYWDEMDRPANQPPGKQRAATMGEVGRGLMELPKVVGQMLIMPGFWLCGLMMTVAMALYVLVPGLLFSYLPMRLFGVMEGTPGFDALLGILLATIAGLVIWGKVNRRQEVKREARRKDKLWQETNRLQAEVLAKLADKGRLHPETGYAYQALGKNLEALGERERARQAYQQGREIFRETLGAAHPEANYFGVIEKERVVIQPRPEVVQTNPGVYDGPEIFDTRRVLISIFGALLAISVMSAVIIGFGFGIELILSILK
jgi:hypothetical protein